MKVRLRVNGRRHEADASAADSLMNVLRRLGYASVKNGCANGDCGTCAVLLDGRAVNACLVFAGKADGHEVQTVESLARNGEMHPLQRALLAEGGIQCGFCTPGVILTALDLLSRTPEPTEHEVRRALAANLCRCTGYDKIIDGVLGAARIMREGTDA
jgi:carbon-monoxide dehydrogenase small subunit